MKIEKLLKRFLKENSIYGSKVSKDTLEFSIDYEEAMMPFNSFRWDTTNEGHNYWYSKSMEWVMYLYENLDNVDAEDKEQYSITTNAIKDGLNELILFYCLENSKEEELMKIEAYKDAKELYDKLSPKEETNIKPFFYDTSSITTTTTAYA